jgi:hypothetical protein
MLSIRDSQDYWNNRAAEVAARLSLAASQQERGRLLRLHEVYMRLVCATMLYEQIAAEPRSSFAAAMRPQHKPAR